MMSDTRANMDKERKEREQQFTDRLVSPVSKWSGIRETD